MTSVDILVITALKEEQDAAIEVDGGSWKKRTGPNGFSYRLREPDEHGLRWAIARASGMAGTHAMATALLLANELSPRCLAMCGVCAGRRGDTGFGDVVVADRVFQYDYGKRKVEDGVSKMFGDITTHNLDPRWLQAIQDFDPRRLGTWRAADDAMRRLWLLERLIHDEDPNKHPSLRDWFPGDSWPATRRAMSEAGEIAIDDAGELTLTGAGRNAYLRHRREQLSGPSAMPYRVRAGPIGSGNQVIADRAVMREIAKYQRKVLGIEMEGAAIGLTKEIARLEYFLVAKGVMDYADEAKNDGYKAFAARASAEVMFAFLREQLGAEASTDVIVGNVTGDESSNDVADQALPADAADVVSRLYGSRRATKAVWQRAGGTMPLPEISDLRDLWQEMFVFTEGGRSGAPTTRQLLEAVARDWSNNKNVQRLLKGLPSAATSVA